MMTHEQTHEYVVLAAGRGLRFHGLGSFLNKAMYPIDGKPFLAYTIEQLVIADPLARLTIVVGHLGGQICTYFNENPPDIPITYIVQSHPTGTADALRLVDPLSPVIVWLADVFISARMFTAIRETAKDTPILTGFPIREPESVSYRLSAVKGAVTSSWFGDGSYLDTGLWYCLPRVINELSPVSELEHRYLQELDFLIARGGKVKLLSWPMRLHLGDTIDDLHNTTTFLGRS